MEARSRFEPSNAVESEDRLEHALRVVPGRYVSRVGHRYRHRHSARAPREDLRSVLHARRSGGSGLGLATTHSIIKNHGGFVTVQSQAGRGTTMRISVPAAAVDRIAEPWRRAAEREGAGERPAIAEAARARHG